MLILVPVIFAGNYRKYHHLGGGYISSVLHCRGRPVGAEGQRELLQFCENIQCQGFLHCFYFVVRQAVAKDVNTKDNVPLFDG
jgi:hypothetical protein